MSKIVKTCTASDIDQSKPISSKKMTSIARCQICRAKVAFYITVKGNKGQRFTGSFTGECPQCHNKKVKCVVDGKI